MPASDRAQSNALRSAERISPEDHLGLARSCAARYAGRGIEYDELYSAACLGLCKAAAGFDPSRGLCFSTYAVPVILGEIRQLFRNAGTVRVSRGLAALGQLAQRRSEKFFAEHGREPRISELAELLGVSVEEAAEALCASQRPLSLSPPADDEDDRAPEIPVPSFETGVTEHVALSEALARLPEADRVLVVERYINGRTQTATAAILGMSQVQVSRREKKILTALRAELR